MSKKTKRVMLRIPKHQEELIKSSLNPQKLIRDLVNADMQAPKVLTPANHCTKPKPVILNVFFNDEEFKYIEKHGKYKKSAFIFALINQYIEDSNTEVQFNAKRSDVLIDRTQSPKSLQP